MASRKQLEAAVARYGATLDERDDLTLYIDAPPGKVWSCDDIHAIVVRHANNCGQSWKPQAYAQALRDMAHGLTDCPHSDCDICEETASPRA